MVDCDANENRHGCGDYRAAPSWGTRFSPIEEMIAVLLPILFAASLAAGQGQTCPAEPVALPAALKGWRELAAMPTLGHAFEVRGADPATVRGLTPDAVARGGLAALVPFEIRTQATYSVALSDGAWVDVVAGDKVMPSSSHRHGPACSGIHKIIDFRLQPGRYALHISAMTTPSVRVMITRV
jgi:hypothetical protein